jgi:hypothetical protein
VGEVTSSEVQSRRTVMKRALQVSAYSAPLIIAATTAGRVAAATPAPTPTLAPTPIPPTGVFAVTVMQQPPDDICEGPGLPLPVAMPVTLSGTLTGATPNQTLDIYILPATFIPPAAPQTTYTKVGTITTSGTGAATIEGSVTVSIPAQKIATATVNLVPSGGAPTNALYSKTVTVFTFCD